MMHDRKQLRTLVVLIAFTLCFPARQVFAGAAHPAVPLIIDHHCTDLSSIPSASLEAARNLLRVAYGHTSHGSQPITGMQLLMGDPSNGHLYDFNTTGDVTPGVLSIDDRRPAGDLGQDGDLGWAAATRAYLDGAGSDRNVMIWSWCGGVSDNTVAGINTYLNEMDRLEAEYPGVTFVYMTGHLDGTGQGGNLHQRNEQIRSFCRANGKVLFDFADIESFDPSGTGFLDRGADDGCNYDGGNWADQWCEAHPGQCASCDCAHSHCLNCQLKGRAFWWMFANLVSGGPADCPCDLDGSGRVDGFDLGLFAPCYGARSGQSRYDSEADFDGNGTVDGDDLAILAGCFGSQA